MLPLKWASTMALNWASYDFNVFGQKETEIILCSWGGIDIRFGSTSNPMFSDFSVTIYTLDAEAADYPVVVPFDGSFFDWMLAPPFPFYEMPYPV